MIVPFFFVNQADLIILFVKIYQRESKLSVITPKMEDIILRFPMVAKSIFAELDNGSLTNCKMVSNPWARFITTEKLPWLRMILTYSGNMVEFFDHWKKTLKRAPVEIVQELALMGEEFYRANQSNLLKGIVNCLVAA